MDYNIHWNNFVKGNRKALAAIFRGFYEELYNYGLKITTSSHLTEDCLQDLFLKFWVNREKLPAVKNIKAFLFASFRNMLLDALKWQKKLKSEINIKGDELLEIEFSTEDILIKKQIDLETRKNLLDALNNLSTRQKEAIYLRFFEDLDLESIAAIMEINLQSVKNFIHRGIKELRDINFL